MKGPEFICKDR